jgi:hypothetical protein
LNTAYPEGAPVTVRFDPSILKFPPSKVPLRNKNFRSFACTPYKWDAVNFKYTLSGPAHPCKYEPPK